MVLQGAFTWGPRLSVLAPRECVVVEVPRALRRGDPRALSRSAK